MDLLRAFTICWITLSVLWQYLPLQWRHNESDGVSNHQPHDYLLNRYSSRRWQKTSKIHVTGLCVGNSPVTGEFPAQRARNAVNVFIWWRHHARTVWHCEIFIVSAADCKCEGPKACISNFAVIVWRRAPNTCQKLLQTQVNGAIQQLSNPMPTLLWQHISSGEHNGGIYANTVQSHFTVPF